MHNKHFFIVEAETAKQACNRVDGELIERDLEGADYFTVIGAIHINTDKFTNTCGDKDYDRVDWSIKGINDDFTNMVSEERYNKLLKQLDEAKEQKNWWLVRYIAIELYGIEEHKGKPFDVLNFEEVNGGNFTSYGITDLLDTATPHIDNVYLVVVDFHS